jgi:hypothetical protein
MGEYSWYFIRRPINLCLFSYRVNSVISKEQFIDDAIMHHAIFIVRIYKSRDITTAPKGKIRCFDVFLQHIDAEMGHLCINVAIRSYIFILFTLKQVLNGLKISGTVNGRKINSLNFDSFIKSIPVIKKCGGRNLNI